MHLGYTRPLQESDLYTLQSSRSAELIGEKIEASWLKRVEEAKRYNASGKVGTRKWWGPKRKEKKASLVFSMNDSIAWWFWSSGILKVVGDTAQVTSPLVVKVSNPSSFYCSPMANGST
jgi:hypothetical protein